jgi:cytochrome c peroxidase
MSRLSYIIFCILVAAMQACSKTEMSPVPQPVELEVPANFPVPPSMPDNPLTREGIELGRRLFYDKRLSGNNTISCASCHSQSLSFSDGVALSQIGVSGSILHRHAPALLNMAWANNGLFWDGGSTNLESQAFAPLANKDEMNQELYELVNELKAVPDYVNRFREAFNDPEIKTGSIVKALAQFQRTLIAGQSRYDKFRRQEPGATLTVQEREGLQLVQSKCMGCHQGELFTDNRYHNNGIDQDFSDASLEGLFQGRFRISYDPADLGSFKTPTLRNVMLTAPYMHDGRFATINAVLDHYSSGVLSSPSLDPLMKQNGGMPGIPLSNSEKQSIIAFLKALTDESFISNPRFSNPH